MQEKWGCSLGTRQGWLHRKSCYWSSRRSCCSVTQAKTINRESRIEAWAISGPPGKVLSRHGCERVVVICTPTYSNQQNVTSSAFVACCSLGHDLKEATRHFHTQAQRQQRLSVKTHKRTATHMWASLCVWFNRINLSHHHVLPEHLLVFFLILHV